MLHPSYSTCVHVFRPNLTSNHRRSWVVTIPWKQHDLTELDAALDMYAMCTSLAFDHDLQGVSGESQRCIPDEWPRFLRCTTWDLEKDSIAVAPFKPWDFVPCIEEDAGMLLTSLQHYRKFGPHAGLTRLSCFGCLLHQFCLVRCRKSISLWCWWLGNIARFPSNTTCTTTYEMDVGSGILTKFTVGGNRPWKSQLQCLVRIKVV